jgi:pyruvate ferredoxin oxidoreductase gamma subunit
MIEIRFHGRGGQGAVTSAELLAQTAVSEGKHAQAFPSFGPERRGAPVVAYARVDESKINLRCKISAPDVALVLDESLLDIVNPSEGMNKKGILVLNTGKSVEELRKKYDFGVKLALVDALKIAKEELGVPITNTTMLGALLKATGVVNVQSMIEPLNRRFGRLAQRNINALERAYKETFVEG